MKLQRIFGVWVANQSAPSTLSTVLLTVYTFTSYSKIQFISCSGMRLLSHPICPSKSVTCADVSQLICWWIELNQTLCIPFQAQLAAAIPKVGAASSSSASSPAVKELRKLMEQVDTIKAERDAIEQDLKVQQDDMGELGEIQGWYHNLRNCGLSVKSNPES